MAAGMERNDVGSDRDTRLPENNPLLNEASDDRDSQSLGLDSNAAQSTKVEDLGFPRADQILSALKASGEVPGTGLDKAAGGPDQAAEQAPGIAAEQAPGQARDKPAEKAPDKAPDTAPDTAPEQTTAELIKELGSDSFDTRTAAVQGLVKKGADAMPDLMKAQKSDDAEVKANAQEAASQIYSAAKEKPMGLAPLLANKDQSVADWTAQQVKNDGLSAIPGLQELAKGGDKDVSARAQALTKEIMESKGTALARQADAATIQAQTGQFKKEAGTLSNDALVQKANELVSSVNGNTSVKASQAYKNDDFTALDRQAIDARLNAGKALLERGASETNKDAAAKLNAAGMDILSDALKRHPDQDMSKFTRFAGYPAALENRGFLESFKKSGGDVDGLKDMIDFRRKK